MTQQTIRRLIDAIMAVAGSTEGSWRERREAILAECSDEEKAAIEEFVGWFDQ